MEKICSKCMRKKDISMFSKDKTKKDGIYPSCKECVKSYQRSKEGLVSLIYSSQKKHSRRRGHRAPTYTKEQLMKWLFAQKKFHILYDNWRMSNYKKTNIPSVDRINNNIGYTLANIQLVTWGENEKKGRMDQRCGKLKTIRPHMAVLKFTVDGRFVREYMSVMEAERKTGIPHSNISKSCLGKRKTAGGFMWQYKHPIKRISK